MTAKKKTSETETSDKVEQLQKAYDTGVERLVETQEYLARTEQEYEASKERISQGNVSIEEALEDPLIRDIQLKRDVCKAKGIKLNRYLAEVERELNVAIESEIEDFEGELYQLFLLIKKEVVSRIEPFYRNSNEVNNALEQMPKLQALKHRVHNGSNMMIHSKSIKGKLGKYNDVKNTLKTWKTLVNSKDWNSLFQTA